MTATGGLAEFVDAPDATVRVNITARGSQIEKIDALAEAAGMTRSGYMVRSALSSGEVRRAARKASSARPADKGGT